MPMLSMCSLVTITLFGCILFPVLHCLFKHGDLCMLFSTLANKVLTFWLRQKVWVSSPNPPFTENSSLTQRQRQERKACADCVTIASQKLYYVRIELKWSLVMQ